MKKYKLMILISCLSNKILYIIILNILNFVLGRGSSAGRASD